MVEPDSHLPKCYSVNAPVLSPSKVQAFSEGYIFNVYLRDGLQEAAPQTLYAPSLPSSPHIH